MGKAELNEAMRSILAENRMDAHREVTAIKQAFFNIRSRESMEEVNAFVEAGNDPRDFLLFPMRKNLNSRRCMPNSKRNVRLILPQRRHAVRRISIKAGDPRPYS